VGDGDRARRGARGPGPGREGDSRRVHPFFIARAVKLTHQARPEEATIEAAARAGHVDPARARAFYRSWIFANGWSEAIGLGTTFLIGRSLAPWLASPGPGEILLGAAAAVVLGTALEGVVVGAAQEQVLKRMLVGLRPGAWTAATALGAGAAWLIGMVPSTVLGLTTSSEPSAGAPTEPPALAQFALAVLLGLVSGPILGSVQARVLRRHTGRAGRWLWANALAWALGIPVIFMGMDLVPWSRGGVAVAVAIYAVCGVTGALVGAIHGRILLQMVSPLRARRLPPAAARR
jgi:hypothetical protein